MNTGQIVKSKAKDEFAHIPNEILQREDMSLQAKGLLCFLLSLPSDWVIYKTHLYKKFQLNKRLSIDSAFKELEKHGYILSTRMYEEGKFRGYNYIVYSENAVVENQHGDVENQQWGSVENLQSGKPAIGKSTHTKKYNKKKLNNKRNISLQKKIKSSSVKPLEERQLIFKSKVSGLTDLLDDRQRNDFYLHWAQDDGIKMRWETETFWNLRARLKSWKDFTPAKRSTSSQSTVIAHAGNFFDVNKSIIQG